MDNPQGQQASHGEKIKSSTDLVYSRSEQIRYLPMPAGPADLNFPPHFTDISENHVAQAATVHRQRELTQYVRGLNGRMEREFEERHDDLRRLHSAFRQIGRDVRDWQNEESTDDSSETVGVSPQQVPEFSADLTSPTVQRPVNLPQPPFDPQPQPIVVVIPPMYAPRPIPAAPRRVRPQQLLPSPQQPAIRVSPESPPFVPAVSSESGVRLSRTSTPTPVPMHPRSGNMGPNVTVIPESSSGSPVHDNHAEGGHRRAVNQPLPIHPRQSMGSDVIIVPLSSASTRSSSPVRGTSRLAQRPAISLEGHGILSRTQSGRSQRSQIPLVVTNPSSPVPTLPGPEMSTPWLPPVVPPAVSQPIAEMQPQLMIQRLPSPSSAAMTSISGPEQTQFPKLGPPASGTRSPVPVPIPRAVTPVLIPQASRGPQVIPHPPTIIRQHSPVSKLRRVQTPFQPTQPTIIRTSPTRLSKRHRPQPSEANPVPVVLPPRQIGRVPPPPQPEVIVMPARTESRRNRQSRRQLRPIDTSVVVPTPAVTAMTYPETVGHVRRTAPFIIPQSPVSSYGDFRAPLQTAEQPAVIRRSPSRSSSHHRPQTTTAIPIQASHPSRLTRRQPTTPDSGPQPKVIVMPVRRESTRSRQNRRQPHPILVPAPAITYPETASHVRTIAQASTPFIIPQPRSSDSSLQSSPQPAEQPVVIRRSPSRSSSRRKPKVLFPARNESMRNHRSRPHLRPIDVPVTEMTYPETVSHARTTAPFIVPQPRSSNTSLRSSMNPEQPVVIRRSPSHSSIHRRPEVVLMPARNESMRSRRSHPHLHPMEPTAVPVTEITYPETVSHARTTGQPPTTIVRQPSPISSNSSVRSSVHAAEQPVVIPSRSTSLRRPQPSTTATPIQAPRPSRLTKRRRPQPTTADPPIRVPSPPPEPKVVVMPARTESMRRRLHPIDASRAVTMMTYPETVSHVRQPPSTAPPRPISSNSSFRSSTQAAEKPVVIRTSPPRSPVRRAPQAATAIPFPSSQPSGPEIVVMPARRRRDQSPSTDATSPIVVPSSLAPGQISGGIAGSRSYPPLPQSGAVAVPLDSEAEEPTGFRPPIPRRPSFSGRDLISYGSRSGSTTRSYSSDDESRGLPFRGRSRSPMSVAPTLRRSPSPPPRIHHPSSTDLWDDRKSRTRTRSQRGWYQRRPSMESISVSPLLQPPAGHRRDVPRGVIPRHITNTISIRERTRTFESRWAEPFGGGGGGGRVIVRGDWERDRYGIMLGPDSGPKRVKGSWSRWLDNL